MRIHETLLVLVVVIAGSTLTALASHDSADALNDTVRVRVVEGDAGKLIIQINYLNWHDQRWHKIGTIRPEDLKEEGHFYHGVRRVRALLFPPVDTFWSRVTGSYSTTVASADTCDVSRTENPDGSVTVKFVSCNVSYYVSVSCITGLNFKLGPYQPLVEALRAGSFGTRLCVSGLADFQPSPGTITVEQLTESLTAHLDSLSPPRSISELPHHRPAGTYYEAPVTPEVAHFEVKVWRRVTDPQNVYLQMRPEGGTWSLVRLGKAVALELNSNP